MRCNKERKARERRLGSIEETHGTAFLRRVHRGLGFSGGWAVEARVAGQEVEEASDPTGLGVRREDWNLIN